MSGVIFFFLWFGVFYEMGFGFLFFFLLIGLIWGGLVGWFCFILHGVALSSTKAFLLLISEN